MKSAPFIIALGLLCVLPSCKTRSSFASTSNAATYVPFAKQPKPAAKTELRTAVVGLVSSNGVETVGLKTGDVMESNTGTTLISHQGVTENLNVRTTAYCHKEADSLQYGTGAADGSQLKFGMVRSAAADWSRYPVGTRFKINGLPYEYVVDDYGSALVGTDTIDLYKPTFSAMNQWGARDVPIEVIEWGCYEKSRQILEGRCKKPSATHVREMHDAIVKKRVSKKIKPRRIPKKSQGAMSASA